ncbi:hypothetical protein TASI_0117 [Taylorella asinigenitalis MCE3]|uniref:Uncharacterized protein n=1 Tax=Taylorella asinigenitalis (strain MCE3) TaxID=1008459 RepID=G4QD91_TAYAM|nr:hypothetical protein TASI_0117 [Taylorella asinigenitalis MCE3]
MLRAKSKSEDFKSLKINLIICVNLLAELEVSMKVPLNKLKVNFKYPSIKA